MKQNENIISILERHKATFYPLIPGLKKDDLMLLDFSKDSPYLSGIDLRDTATFSQLIFGQVLKGKTGIGGFFENRIIYRRSTHYDGDEPRSLHLGLDIWKAAGTQLFSPLAGIIHSVQDNQGFGNYGPTLIMEHQLESVKFYALYGHLTHESIQNRQVGEMLEKGQWVGSIGNFPDNGDWPPHLHWQIMSDMLGHVGDFPGVAAPSDHHFYLQYCIDPHYLLVLTE
ncbi:peptidoglycan DD-metalloendopeptidase family protein [Catalinimonas niigatensis]|uniref:peptidoglycan DD-metalloendopeptidase family protein n=1 Tax=Catalinimonas niigatensis TaxID=1397264 RepID=UPI002665F9B5|nr:peptidoglycan DD-metalloendopeptidase family protein [Catalinimonas niigatensis]WPP50597.1 peptidoglycan DD-metalloendopeptidase family protein [Catalinimonas niigatensis]